MERIFSPWRMEYVGKGDAAPVAGCVFCVGPDDFDASDSLILGLYPATMAILNKFPYNNGHVLLSPRRHVSHPGLLSVDEARELAALLFFATTALNGVYRPEGMNLGMNVGKVAGAGIADHIHFHAVPRWGGDTNFMTPLADTRVLPESLAQTRARLLPAFRDFRP